MGGYIVSAVVVIEVIYMSGWMGAGMIRARGFNYLLDLIDSG
jgi:hypothetical protein